MARPRAELEVTGRLQARGHVLKLFGPWCLLVDICRHWWSWCFVGCGLWVTKRLTLIWCWSFAGLFLPSSPPIARAPLDLTAPQLPLDLKRRPGGPGEATPGAGEATPAPRDVRRWRSMEVGEWQLIKPKREDPGSRFLHTAVVWNDEMVVYGGFVGAVGRRGTWSLNLKDREWRQLSTDGEEPERREEHSAIMWQDEMIIFGGAGGGKHVCDTWALNLRSQKWKRLEPKGEVPKGRCRHSAVLWKDQMIVFGGFDGSSGLSDTWTLGLKLQEWTLLRPMGKLPGAHSGHSAVVLSDQMFVFGGHSGGASNNIWCLNFQAPEWMLLNITGDIPKPRHNHSAVLLGNHMIVFGGEGDHGFNETWSLDLTNNKWKMHSLGNLPTERSKHPAVVWQHEMVIFGGAGGGGGSMRNDTWSLRLAPPSSRTPLALATTPRRPTPRGDGLAPTPREEVGLAAAMGAVTDPMVEEACQAMATMPGNAEARGVVTVGKKRRILQRKRQVFFALQRARGKLFLHSSSLEVMNFFIYGFQPFPRVAAPPGRGSEMGIVHFDLQQGTRASCC